MKKLVSVILTLAILMASFSLCAFAVEDEDKSIFDISNYNDPELDLTGYTMDDIMALSPREFSALVSEFERVYDPFDSYIEEEEEIIIEDNPMFDPSKGIVSPLWTSGEYNHKLKIFNSEGCHEYITGQACALLLDDKGFFSNKPGEIIIYTMQICVASTLPDKDLSTGLLDLYKGHFYDPDTEKNYNGDAKNTAKTNAIDHYYDSIAGFEKKDIEEGLVELGRCLHYIQDACEPHHAANITSTEKGSTHSIFEDYAYDNSERLLNGYKIPASYYTNASTWDVGKIVKHGATKGKALIGKVNNKDDKSEWDSVAKTTLKYATGLSTMVMYKLGLDKFVPFYNL